MDNMKLIMESWRHYQLAEQEGGVTNVGQLKKLINMHRAAAAGKEVAAQGLETAIEQIPGINNIYSIWKGIKGSKDALTKLYGMDDKFQSNTGLDKLNVDDNVSKIVDDKIEAAFINDLLQTIDGMEDEDPIPAVNDRLQAFLASRFASHQVKP